MAPAKPVSLSFSDFSQSIRNGSRHILPKETISFLERMADFIEREKTYEAKTDEEFYRARIGCKDGIDVRNVSDGLFTGQGVEPHSWLDVVPQRAHAADGRLSTRGIPVLYLSDDPVTAAMEVRPFVTDVVTIATVRPHRNLKIADLFIDLNAAPPDGFLNGIPSDQPDQLQLSISWIELAAACSSAVRPGDERLEYLPTQVFAEFIQSQGFDGIRYASAMRISHKNIMVFDPSSIEPVSTKVLRPQHNDLDLLDVPDPSEFQKSLSQSLLGRPDGLVRVGGSDK